MTTAAILLVLLVLTILVYALFIETRMFRTSTVSMPVARLNGESLTVLHISDFHFKKGDEAKLRFLRTLQRTEVDLVVATGDMIDENDGIAYCVEALGGFNARFGAYAVFGAHDHWDTRLINVVLDLSIGGYRKGKPNDFDRLRKELKTAGVTCLQNESHCLNLLSGGELWIIGVDDMFAGLADFPKALTDVPATAVRFLLTHTVEDPAALAGYGFDAVFAGHSHGGQVRFPVIGAVMTRSSLPRKYAWGTFECNGTCFHINNGLGTGKWTSFRFLCPPEATYVKVGAAPIEGLSCDAKL